MRTYTKQTSVQPNSKQRLISLAVASACAAFAPAFAQEAATPTAEPLAGEPAKVIVTGIRAAMQSTLNLKRNSDGIVDGIVADDIGKFPDTNLAESLQRISGVSIDRNQGEGSAMTVRGVGPDLNMVLLNGRQMPTSSLRDQNGRAFDFSNLASESISQIQVYKTSRADTPPGGIGASVNVMTARPFDNPRLQASIGVKAVYDTSHDNLPGEDSFGNSLTPEVSGIYSNVFGNGMFGVSVSGSWQKRNSGENRVSITNGWAGPFRGDDMDPARIPQTVNTVGATVINRPSGDDSYSVPQNISYFMRGTQRERTNGQVTLQFKPNADIVATLDYTYSQNKLHTKYNELSAWFNHGPSNSEWTDGPIASPLYYEEFYNTPQDVTMNGGNFATRSTNNSIGFNTTWKVSNALKLNFDAHHSTAESKADHPLGSNNDLGTASFSRGRTRVDFTNEMPVMSIQGYDIARAPRQVTGSWFQNAIQEMEIDQIQAGGRLSLLESSSLNFGVGASEVSNRTAFQQVQRDTWGGATRPADYAPSLFTDDNLSQYFDKLGGHDNPALFQNMQTFNVAAVREAAIAGVARANGGTPAALAAATASYSPSLDDPEYDRRTVEKNKSLYLQFNTDWDTPMPIHTGIGVRYEKTDILSTGLLKVPTIVNWVAQNELPMVFNRAVDVNEKGSYSNILPSLDFDIELRSDLKMRASYGHTIGRPRYDQIQGGQQVTGTADVRGTNVSRGTPNLKPVKSKNLDLSFEWYYSKQSVVSLGLFNKELSNYAGAVVTNEPQAGLYTPIGGKYFNAAVANGCLVTDTNCIRDYVLTNFDGQPGVVRGPNNASGQISGTITGQPGDPLLVYRVTDVINEASANLKGAEFNIQHMFGASGFGIQANYTYVKSNLKFNDYGTGNQFALVGLSDSANLIGIYEDDNWTVRAAYNWRDRFLAAVTDSGRPNPRYVEPYGQLDVSIGYAWNKNLSLQLEAINLTDETMRHHGRSESQVLSVAQMGPRYMLSARYKF